MYWSPYLVRTLDALQGTPDAAISALADLLLVAWAKDATIFTCGNGGSASTASHLAQDLSKGTLVEGMHPLRALCLCDSVSALTAWANDTTYAHVFSAQLLNLGQSGDVLIAISGSGNSPNILSAVSTAHDLEMRTWGVTGFDGGKLIGLAHRCVHVPCDDMGMVEACHGVIFHWLVSYLQHAMALRANGFVDCGC